MHPETLESNCACVVVEAACLHVAAPQLALHHAVLHAYTRRAEAAQRRGSHHPDVAEGVLERAHAIAPEARLRAAEHLKTCEHASPLAIDLEPDFMAQLHGLVCNVICSTGRCCWKRRALVTWRTTALRRCACKVDIWHVDIVAAIGER